MKINHPYGAKYLLSFILLSILLVSSKLESYCQEEDTEIEIFTIVEEMPKYPGGDEAIFQFIEDNLIYPELAKAKRIEGVVVIEYVVEKDGSLSNIEILRDIGYGCGEEALRLVKSMPTWSPGKQRGQPVPVAFKLPIRFKLGKPSKNFYPSNNNKSIVVDRLSAPYDTIYNYALAVTLGLQSPYGFGGEFSYKLGKHADVNVGMGFGLSGFKGGVGARLYFSTKAVSPYIGANLIYASGLKGIETSTSNTGTTVYNILSDQAIHINGGIKFNTFYNRYLLITAGYALPFNGYEAEYESGFYSEKRQKFMNLSAVGGVQVSATFLFGFKRSAEPTRWKGDSWGK